MPHRVCRERYFQEPLAVTLFTYPHFSISLSLPPPPPPVKVMRKKLRKLCSFAIFENGAAGPRPKPFPQRSAAPTSSFIQGFVYAPANACLGRIWISNSDSATAKSSKAGRVSPMEGAACATGAIIYVPALICNVESFPITSPYRLVVAGFFRQRRPRTPPPGPSTRSRSRKIEKLHRSRSQKYGFSHELPIFFKFLRV